MSTDPASWLLEQLDVTGLEPLRRIVRLHRAQWFRREWPEKRPDVQLCNACSWQPPYPCQTLRLLCLVYADRPGYDRAWAPEEDQ